MLCERNTKPIHSESFSITLQNKTSCPYTNCDSLLNKLNELQIRLFDKNTLICGVKLCQKTV